MALTQDQRDALTQQDSASFQRSAQAAENLVVELVREQDELVDLWKAETDSLVTREQRLYLEVFKANLSVRLGPAIITSTTADSVVDDLVKDAARMTALAWSVIGPELLALVPAA